MQTVMKWFTLTNVGRQVDCVYLTYEQKMERKGTEEEDKKEGR
jgi:hypothetical protein